MASPKNYYNFTQNISLWIVWLGLHYSWLCVQVWCGEPPSVNQFSFPGDLSEGSLVQVFCSIDKGSPPVYFTWMKDGETVPKEWIKSDQKFSVLQIEAVKPNDTGNYTCFAKNILGTDSKSSVLEIRAPPRWIKTPNHVSSLLGSMATLTCVAQGHPTPKVTWSAKKERITNSNSYQVFENGTLLISKVTKETEGDYLCESSNGIGEVLVHTVKLTVNVPARFEEKSAIVTARRDDVARLKCQATGDQPLSISWSKGSVKLDKRTSSRYEVFETLTKSGLISELVIRDTERSDGSDYTCHTENKYGKDDRRVKLVVQEVPGPPQDVRIREVWSRSASVSWSHSYNGNSPISKYVIQYWRDHGTAHRLQELVVGGSQTTALVRDLLPGTAYVLNIVAENAIGRGDSSRTVVFHTGEEEPDAPPVDILIEMKGPTTAFISWKAPPRENWNGVLQGYYIGYRVHRENDPQLPYSYRRREASSNVTLEFQLSGLLRGTEYDIVLKAYNGAGSGPASQEKVVKTRDAEVPDDPRVFVIATSQDSLTIKWAIRSGHEVTGYNIHYRQENGPWLELPIAVNPNNTYTLTNLHSGSTYQIYLTASNHLGKGDPSSIITVRTEKSGFAVSSPVEELEYEEEMPIYMDLAIVIPVAAVALAIIVIVISACICAKKMKATPRPDALMYGPAVNTGTMASQRYVEMEKMSDQDGYPAPYATLSMKEDWTNTKDRQEMKTYIPKNPVQDRPLPNPKQATLGRLQGHIYDSAQ